MTDFPSLRRYRGGSHATKRLIAVRRIDAVTQTLVSNGSLTQLVFAQPNNTRRVALGRRPHVLGHV